MIDNIIKVKGYKLRQSGLKALSCTNEELMAKISRRMGKNNKVFNF